MNRQEKVAVLSQREILNILYADCYKSWVFLPKAAEGGLEYLLTDNTLEL